jgi:hypothetical protein
VLKILFGSSLQIFIQGKFGVLQVKLKEDRLQYLKSDLQGQQNIFTVAAKMKQQFMDVLIYQKLLKINQKTSADRLRVDT